jgi:hypothetical protein
MSDWIMDQKSKQGRAWAAAEAAASFAATAAKHARDTDAARCDCQAAIEKGLFDQARSGAEKAWLCAGHAAQAAWYSGEAYRQAVYHDEFYAGRSAESSYDSAKIAADNAWREARCALVDVLEAAAKKEA